MSSERDAPVINSRDFKKELPVVSSGVSRKAAERARERKPDWLVKQRYKRPDWAK